MRFNEHFNDNGETELRLKNAMFCRDPFCPFCAEGRAMAYRRKVKKAMPRLVQENPGVRYIVATFTVKNPPISNLRKTISWMSKGYAKLRRELPDVILGDIRALEVTKAQDDPDHAHPHFHCLIAVPAEYFDRAYDLYMSNEEWAELWGKCLGVDYVPSTHVTAISPRGDQPLEQAITEVVKYCTKASDLEADGEWLCEYIDQMLHVKRFSTSGLLRTYLKSIEDEPTDYIGKDEEERLTGRSFLFRWDDYYNRYILISVDDDEIEDASDCGKTVENQAIAG